MCELAMRLRIARTGAYSGDDHQALKFSMLGNSRITQRFGVRGVPTVMVFKDGKMVGQHVGLTNKETLLKLLGG